MDNNIFMTVIIAIAILYSIYVIIYERRSVQSKLFEDIIKISGYKNYNSKEENIDKEIKKRKKEGEKKYKFLKFPFKSKIEAHKFNNMDYYVFNKNERNKKIFYIHGGSYFDQPLFLHLEFCDKLAKRCNCEVILPVYPKTPFSNYKESQEKVLGLYKKLFKKNEKVILMGDSAGGGFCLALCYLLNKEGKKQPDQTILLSPWLDVSMSNPDINYLEELDPQLSVVALKKMGKLWATSTNVKNPLVSPIYGDVSILENITLFIGTHEVFLPDSRLFYKKCKDHKVEINYLEYKKMTHVFLLQPIPEAKKALKVIVKMINKT